MQAQAPSQEMYAAAQRLQATSAGDTSAAGSRETGGGTAEGTTTTTTTTTAGGDADDEDAKELLVSKTSTVATEGKTAAALKTSAPVAMRPGNMAGLRRSGVKHPYTNLYKRYNACSH